MLVDALLPHGYITILPDKVVILFLWGISGLESFTADMRCLAMMLTELEEMLGLFEQYAQSCDKYGRKCEMRTGSHHDLHGIARCLPVASMYGCFRGVMKSDVFYDGNAVESWLLYS